MRSRYSCAQSIARSEGFAHQAAGAVDSGMSSPFELSSKRRAYGAGEPPSAPRGTTAAVRSRLGWPTMRQWTRYICSGPASFVTRRSRGCRGRRGRDRSDRPRPYTHVERVSGVMSEDHEALGQVSCSNCGERRPSNVATKVPRPPCPRCGDPGIAIEIGIAEEVDIAESLELALHQSTSRSDGNVGGKPPSSP